MMRTQVARLPKLVAAIVAAVLSLTLLTAAPASAGWSDSGPGSTGGGSGNNGAQTGGDFTCGQNISGGIPGVLYYKLGKKWLPWWEYGYQSCVGQGASSLWNNTGYQELCPSGFLVYRFYGNLSNPAAAVTRSRVNLTQWCAGESGYSFPATNPLDAGQVVGSPWRAQEAYNPDLYYSRHPNATYFRNDAGQLTTSWPTRVAGACEATQSTATMRTWYGKAGENERIAMRAALGTDYWITSARGQRPASGQAEAGIRNATGYPFSWAQWRANKEQPPAPVAAANADGFYLTGFDWEDRACASPFQFLSSTNAPAAQRTVIGTCYIPLIRKRIELRNTRTGAYAWKYPTLQHDWNRLNYGDGERLSLYYRNSAFTPGGPGGDSRDAGATGLSAAQQSQLISGWRSAMAADYSSWWDSGLYNAAGAQVVPVNAYTRETGGSLTAETALDKGAALDQLTQSARCRVGTAIAFDAPQPYDFADVGASADVKVANHEVLQVSPTSVQIKVSAPSTVTCSTGACPSGTSLTTLSWNASVTGTAGFKLYQAKSATDTIPLGYDGMVSSEKVVSAGKTRSETFTVRFLHPTRPEQVVRLSVADLKGTYTQTVQTQGLRINGYSPVTGERYTVDTGNLQAQKTSPLTVTATGTPRALTRTSSTSYIVDIPVVGAVQVPVSKR